MKKIYSITALLSLVALVGCRKDVPLPPSDPEAEFYAKAIVDGRPLDFFAGQDDYYMFTDYSETEGVPHFEGSLLPESGAGEGWTVRFRGNDQGNEASQEEAFELGQHSLKGVYSKEIISGEVLITTNPLFVNEIYSSFIWSFQFGAHTQETSPTFVWDTTRFTPQPITTLTTVYASNCEAHTSRCVDTRFPDTRATFDIERITDSEFKFFIPTSPINEWDDINRVNWSINGNFMGSDSSIVYTLNSPYEDVVVELTVQHTNGAGTCITRTLELQDAGPDPCIVDFNYYVEPNYEEDSVQYNSIELIYTSPQGISYSTSFHNEPGVVIIEEVDEYQNDLDGRPTKKVRLTGDFLLQDVNGNAIRIEDADFVIAVATRDP